MSKAYLVFGMLVCLLFSYAAYSGWTVTDPFESAHSAPQGYQHSVNHK